MAIRNAFNQPGAFAIGCNYWASHAGTAMWNDWRPEVVADDLKQLAASGLRVLRVFPLWSDFQPIVCLYGGGGVRQEIRLGGECLPDHGPAQAGVSQQMLDRFRVFADLARQNGLELIVGLVTGWMSGRLFVPPALEGLNILTSPEARRWQVRFVRCFVKTFLDHPAVAAWDLGNECNCMGGVENAHEAWDWTSAIACAIRAEDGTRPVVSGMHSLQANARASWNIFDQGELTDVLTTHPYPLFTPRCDQDPLNEIRNCLHATAESRLYADLGRRPCLVEEAGTLGPMISSDTISAEYLRAMLFSAWANDCPGLLWWCAFDQDHLVHAPYDWNAIERELGLFRKDHSPKPQILAMQAFSQFLSRVPFDRLPAAGTDAICLIGETDPALQWDVAFSAYVLAKQAGLQLRFRHVSQTIEDCGHYILPCLSGQNPLSRTCWLELLRKVEAGASLLVTNLDGFLSPFNEPFGMDVQLRYRPAGVTRFTLPGLCGDLKFSVDAPVFSTLSPRTAEVLGADEAGNPVYTRTPYGKGFLYFCALPLERYLAQTPGAFHADCAQPFWQIYRSFADAAFAGRAAHKDEPMIGLTEHAVSAVERIIVAINYSSRSRKSGLTLQNGWRLKEVVCGGALDGEISGNDALVAVLQR